MCIEIGGIFMKKSRKLLLILAIVLSVFITSCGSKKPTAYDGKWVAMSAESMGVSIAIKNVFEGDCFFVIDGSNKAKFTIGKETGTGTWEEKDNKIIFELDGEKLEGTKKGDAIIIDNALNSGIKLTFVKEGSIKNAPDSIKNIVGNWNSIDVSVGIEPAKTSVEGLNDISQALSINFKDDFTADITLMGKSLGTAKWAIADGLIPIEIQGYKIIFNVKEDKKGVALITKGDEFYEMNCIKK